MKAGNGNPLAPENRRSLLWLGRQVPKYLLAECYTSELEAIAVSPEEVEELAPTARALAVEVRGDDTNFAEWVPPIIALGLNHGLGVTLLLPDAGDDAAPELDEDALLRYFEQVKGVARNPDRVPALYQNVHKIVRWVRDQSPGPGANLRLAIRGVTVVDAIDRLLLQRAFYDFGAITLAPLGDGMSGARVWQVWPEVAGGVRSGLSFVAKIDSRTRIQAERSNAGQVRRLIETRRHAPIHNGRTVDGYESGLVVYDMLQQVESFRSAVTRHPVPVIADLFGCTLSSLYVDHAPRDRHFAEVCQQLGLLRNTEILDRAMTDSGNTTSAITIQEILQSLPEAVMECATIHGDLHALNLFAVGHEVSIIDYGSVQYTFPVAADAACLEVCLAFPAGPRANSALQECHDPTLLAWLPSAYGFPLPRQVGGHPSEPASWLARAIEDIRMQVARLEPNPIVYPLFLAVNLLRYASYPDNGSAEARALACGLGSSLIVAAASLSAIQTD